VLLFLTLPALAKDACADLLKVPRTGRTVATADGLPVTSDMIDAVLASVGDEVRTQVEEAGQMAEVVDQTALGDLLAQEGCRRGLGKSGIERQRLALALRGAMAQLVLDAVVAERSTPERLRGWYDDHAVQFRGPEVHARHILVPEESEARAILAELTQGADFAAVAKAKSRDPGSGPDGGDLGWFKQGRMVEAFDAAVFGAPVGQVSGPVQTRFGWHVFIVDERREVSPFAEVESQVRARLRDELVSEYLEEMRKAHPIVVQ
jgi:peptidyl-prolyl cis-trans isomerase C